MPRKTTGEKPEDFASSKAEPVESSSTAVTPLPTGPAVEQPSWAQSQWRDQPRPSTIEPSRAPFTEDELKYMAEAADFLDPAPAPDVHDTGKRCECGATKFQGPYYRGPIVNGRLVPEEMLLQCVRCHAVRALDELQDFPIVHLTFEAGRLQKSESAPVAEGGGQG